MTGTSSLLSSAQRHAALMLEVRRDIHRCPELGFEETRTATRIRAALDGLGLTAHRAIGTTGTLVDIDRGPGRAVLLRADIDALPIQEQTGLPFASQTPGVMHACGHDAHTAIVLGAAAVLREREFAGRVRVFFQPSEERNALGGDGLSGAERCLNEGLLDGIDVALGLHQFPELPCGQVGVTAGPVMAAADMFEIVVEGRAAHAGVNPQAGIDAVLVAAELVVSLQTIVSRNTAPEDTAVVSVCTVEGGTTSNIIADRVTLTGTVRAYRPEIYDAICEGIARRCEKLARIHGARIHYRPTRALPATVNDPEVTAVARTAAIRVFGADNVLTEERTMGGEDFAYIAQQVPACFAFLGTRVAEGAAHGLHSPHMVVNEDALPLGAAYLAEAALALLADPD